MEVIWGLAKVSKRGQGVRVEENSTWRNGWFSLGEGGGLGLVGWGIPRTGGVVLRILWNGQGAGSFRNFLGLRVPLSGPDGTG